MNTIAPTIAGTIAPSVVAPRNRKYKALILAIAIYGMPVILTFVLVLTKQAAFLDFKNMAIWMGAALSPAFVAYIGGVALEGYAEKRWIAPQVPPQSETQPTLVEAPKP